MGKIFYEHVETKRIRGKKVTKNVLVNLSDGK
jgi:hypothetical protein